jgi:hypothetical protein
MIAFFQWLLLIQQSRPDLYYKNGDAPHAAAQSPVRSYGGQLRAPAATLRLRLLEVISSLPTAGMESSYAALLR